MSPAMLHPDLAVLLIAAHGLDGALYGACERFLILERIGDHGGAEMWGRVVSLVWRTISALMGRPKPVV
jgi:hypothetical protein